MDDAAFYSITMSPEHVTRPEGDITLSTTEQTLTPRAGISPGVVGDHIPQPSTWRHIGVLAFGLIEQASEGRG